jgi:hypothetical protein
MKSSGPLKPVGQAETLGKHGLFELTYRGRRLALVKIGRVYTGYVDGDLVATGLSKEELFGNLMELARETAGASSTNS